MPNRGPRGVRHDSKAKKQTRSSHSRDTGASRSTRDEGNAGRDKTRKNKKGFNAPDYFDRTSKTRKDSAVNAAKEAKNKGNAAFKENNWGEAIKQYSRALKVDSKDYVCLANRSAAFLKKKQAEKALQDAERCIKLKDTYVKGHIRKAGALHEMKKFAAEVKAYQHGLECCPGDQLLRKGLEQAKRARSKRSKACHEANKSQATLDASKSTRRKANRSTTVSEFVKQSKASIELKMASLEAQLNMIKEFETMKIDEKLDLLFTLLDKDKSGSLDPRELADGLQQRLIGLSMSQAIEKAIEMVDTYDEDGDQALDRDEFENVVHKMVIQMDIPAHEFCEFLVFQILFQDSGDSGDDEEEEERTHPKDEKGQLVSALRDPRMETLFTLFDKNGDGAISFKEVACGLYHMTKDMEESTKATTSLLLMMDVNDKRQLEFEQFAKLILAIAAAAATSFDEVADDLTLAITSKRSQKMDKETMRALTLAERDYRKARERQQSEAAHGKIMNALSYGRTMRLFELWDANSDGVINFEELFAGLQRYQAAAAKEKNLIIDAEKVAMQLMALDTDGDHCLDKEEFATAMVTYADAMKTDLHQLIDFMCVVTALGEYL